MYCMTLLHSVALKPVDSMNKEQKKQEHINRT